MPGATVERHETGIVIGTPHKRYKALDGTAQPCRRLAGNENTPQDKPGNTSGSRCRLGAWESRLTEQNNVA